MNETAARLPPLGSTGLKVWNILIEDGDPSSTSQVIDALSRDPPDELRGTMRAVAARVCLLARTGAVEPATRFFEILSEVEKAVSSRLLNDEARWLVMWEVALSTGDVDLLLELAVSNPKLESAIVRLLRALAGLQSRLTKILDETRARLLVGLMVPIPAPLALERLLAQHWILDASIGGILDKEAEGADQDLRPGLEHLIGLIDQAKRVRTAHEVGRRFVAEAVRLSAAARARVGAKQIGALLREIESCEKAPLDPEAWEGAEAALRELEVAHAVDVAPHWFVWCAAKTHKSDPMLPYFAGRLNDAMRPAANTPEIATARSELCESALLADPQQVAPFWFAEMRYSCARSIAIAFDFLGGGENLARRWLRHATAARDLAVSFGDLYLVTVAEEQILGALRQLQSTGATDVPQAADAVREWIKQESDETAMQVRIARRVQLAKLLLSQRDSLGEARDLLRAADNLLGDASVVHLRHRVDSFRAAIEVQLLESGLDGDAEVAVELCERLLPSLDVADDPDGCATTLLTYVAALSFAQLPRTRAFAPIERLLGGVGGRLSPEHRAGLLIIRAESHGSERDVGLSDSAYNAALRDIEEAEACFAGVDADVVAAKANVHGQAGRVEDAIDCVARARSQIRTPRHVLKLDVLECKLRLQRDRSLDRQKILAHVDTWLSAPADAAQRTDVIDAIVSWLSIAVCRPSQDASPTRIASLRTFATSLSAKHAPDVLLLTMALEAHAQKTGAVAVALQLRTRADRARTGAEEFHWLRLALYFAIAALGPGHDIAQVASRRLEVLLMNDAPPVVGLNAATMLVDIATARMAASDEPSLARAEAAVRLIRRIDHFVDVERLPQEVRSTRLRTLWFASLRRMGLTLGQSVEEVLKESDRLLSRARANVPDAFDAFVTELCHWLTVYPTIDSAPLRRRAEEIATEHGVTARVVVTEPDTAPDALQRGEQLAEVSPMIPRAAEDAIRLLEPLLEKEPERWRVECALGRAWLHHPGRSRTTIERALSFLGRAAESCPPSDDRYFSLLAELADALRQAAFSGVGHAERTRVQVLIGAALAREDLPSVSTARAQLLGALAQIEVLGPIIMKDAGAASLHRIVELFELALRAVPAGEDQLRFGLLVTLANARRRFGATKDLESAVVEYRAALDLGSRVDILPLEIARAQKCLADALGALGGAQNLDEGRALLRQALIHRRAETHPELRAETLLSLTRIELESSQLQAARRAVVEAGSLVHDKANPSLAFQIAQVRAAVDQKARAQGLAPDADGVGRTARVGELFLETMRSSNAEVDVPHSRAELISGAATLATGDLGRSTLGHAIGEALFGGMERARGEQQLPSELDADPWADQILEKMSRAPLVEALGPLASLVMLGQFRKLAPAKWRALMNAASALTKLEAADDTEWERLTLLRAVLPLLLQAREGDATIEDWDMTLGAIDTAVRELEARSPRDPVLDEFRNRLGVVLFRHPGTGRAVRWRRARALWQGVVERARKSGANAEECSALLNCGALLTAMSVDDATLLTEAIRCYDELLEPLGDKLSPAELAKALNSRGWARSRLPSSAQPFALRDARTDLTQALDLTRKHRLTDLEPGVRMHLGIVNADLMFYENPAEHFQAAITEYTAALAGFEEMADRVGIARTLHNRGDLLSRSADREAAIAGMSDLVGALHLRTGRTEEELETLASIMTFRARLPERFSELDDALLDQIDTVCSRPPGDAPVDRILPAHWYRISILVQRIGSDEAIAADVIAAIDAAIEFAEAVRDNSPTLETELMANNWLGRFGAARIVCGARLGEAELDLLQHSARTRGRSLMDTRVAIEAGALGRRNAPQPIAAPQAGLARLEAEASARTAEAARRKLPLADVSIETLSAALKQRPCTAYVDLTVSALGTTAIVAFIADGTLAVETRSLSLTEAEVHSWLRRPIERGRGWLDILESLDRPSDWLTAVESADASLTLILLDVHQRLLSPALRGLQERGIRNLVFSIQGPLATIPIAAAARVGSDGRLRHLVEDFDAIRFVPGVHAFVSSVGMDAPSSIPRSAVVVAADPERKLKELTTKAKEIAEKLRTAGVEVELLTPHDEQSPEEILRLLRRSDTAWLICHGSFDGDDLRSCGVILEGRVAPGQRSNMLTCDSILNVEAPLAVRLVVLASCQSGRTRVDDAGGEWLGISGSLLRAGARQVIAALWDVSYAAALDLIPRILERVVAGDSADTALCSAMRSALSDARRAVEPGASHPLATSIPKLGDTRGRRLIQSPLFWAAFQLLSAG